MEQRLKIKLGQLLTSLSFALDVAENRYFNHSRRTAYIAYCIAKEMNLNEDDIIDIYYTALIHDIGMAGHLSSHSVREIHFHEDLKKEHCINGYKILEKLPLKDRIKEYILYHHEEWEGTGPFGLQGDEIPLAAQIIHLADYFELFFLRKVEDEIQFKNLDSIHRWLNIYINKMFSNEICEAFSTVLLKEKFWFDLVSTNTEKAIQIIEPGKDVFIDIDDLHKISEAFSMLIDAKSKFTCEHSKQISIITGNFATYLGYNPLMIEKLTIAANLHDIGKFVVPLNILEKPSKLNLSEFEIIKSHVYYTKLILKQIKGLEDIAEWAGNHHEKLNGKGYPEKLDERTLTKEDQIITLADIYQALTEDRPYRKGMKPKDAISIMEDMAHRGEICNNMLSDFKQVVLY
ncbi:HD-GYP domain-containing protein [Clostridium sp. Cult1]|jgi:HD-GYP domain-containing protein (c-di-GMP phosphodiesterase class II)|uniref:HD-GYP domain-containing protein n=1 Tax=Clostridium sp. Cult1 TaxID=2079002 RepID=UPI001F1D8E0E|nr:HD domain-containing phosphohydrolase [Clostridium sp. Cult1]MCF6462815.1 metal-dependent phosphohydrolase [Clostridium sp. Cult1]